MIHAIFDTNVYTSQKYFWESQKFKILKHLISGGYLKLYIPEVVDREIAGHLLAIGRHAHVSFRKIIKDYPSVLTVVPGQKDHILSSIEECTLDDKTRNHLLKDYYDFKKSISAAIIPVNPQNTLSVLDNYFNTVPPFEKKKKKKNEFPDAFAIASIKAHFIGDYFVVSDDTGWKLSFEGVDNCTFYSNVSEFLKYMDNISLDGERLKAARELIDANLGEITDELSHRFPDRGFMANDSWDEYVSDVVVNDVIIDDIMTGEVLPNSTSFSASVNIHYTATVDYDDPDSWTRDSDTKKIIYRERVEGAELSRAYAAPGIFVLETTDDGKSFLGISSFSVDLPNTIDFEIEEYDDYK